MTRRTQLAEAERRALEAECAAYAALRDGNRALLTALRGQRPGVEAAARAVLAAYRASPSGHGGLPAAMRRLAEALAQAEAP